MLHTKTKSLFLEHKIGCNSLKIEQSTLLKHISMKKKSTKKAILELPNNIQGF